MNTLQLSKTFVAGWAMVLLAGFLLAGPALHAQDEEQEKESPPEILSSDLTLKTQLESDTLEITFVVVDADKVAEVTIDGEPQQFQPDDTVVITINRVFTQDVTKITVVAKDEKGNSKTVTYTVYLPGVDPEKLTEAKTGLSWFVSYDVRFEIDTNPSNDLSSPVAIEGIDLVGVVPDDQQTDNRTNITVFGGINLGDWSFYGGLTRIGYAKDDFAKRYDVEINMLGAAYRTPKGGFEASYLFSDINLGTGDYALTHTISPGWRKISSDEEGRHQTLYRADVVIKDFASSTQEDTTVFGLIWEYKFQDKEQQDAYRRKTVLGTASEGIEDSEFTYLGMDLDWFWKYDSGLLWDLGLGVQYRKYKNDEPLSTETVLGDTRVDLPMRISTALGWQFSSTLKLMANYRYLFNLSNKTPYVRQIYGVSLIGSF